MKKDRFKVKSRSELVAEGIVSDISSRAFTNYLPGYRQLMHRYGVSQLTVLSAISLLEHQGVVSVSAKGKKRKILTPSESCEKAQKTLLVIRMKVSDSNGMALAAMAECKRIWKASTQGDVIEREIPSNVSNAQTLIGKLVEEVDPDGILTYILPDEINRVAFHTGVPCYFLGGSSQFPEKFPYASCGYNQIEATILALRKLKEAGHTKIVTPIHPLYKVTLACITSAYKAVFPEIDEATLKAFTPEIKEDYPEVWQSFLERYFSSVKPTAIIVNRLSHMLAVYSFCSARKLSIPDDVSLVCEGHDPEMEWVIPSPSSMRYPFKKQSKHFMRWVDSGMSWSNKARFELEWEQGGSVARLKK